MTVQGTQEIIVNKRHKGLILIKFTFFVGRTIKQACQYKEDNFDNDKWEDTEMCG